MILEAIKFLLLLPVATLVELGILVIFIVIMQWFLNKWDQEEKMWKCKECGEKIQGYYIGYVDIDKKGCAIDGTQEEEELIRYTCACGRIIKFGDIKELKRVADWVDDEDVEM